MNKILQYKLPQCMIDIIGSYNYYYFSNNIEMFFEFRSKTYYIWKCLTNHSCFDNKYIKTYSSKNIKTIIKKKYIPYYDGKFRWYICIKN